VGRKKRIRRKGREKNNKKKARKVKGKKEKRKKREGYYRPYSILSTLHSWEKLFCQMFFQIVFNFTRESAPPTQPQPKLPHPPP
jgi:hypothetical protein